MGGGMRGRKGQWEGERHKELGNGRERYKGSKGDRKGE